MTLSPDFLHELKKRFSGDLRLDSASRVLYSTDASIYQIAPLGVAIPKTQDDLHAAVELAARHNIPILPRGSGSSLAGQAIGEALILDCSRFLDSIIEINPETRSAIVEPGVILSNLNRAAAKHGLMFGPDPASAERATMGGVIGNNATGAHSILYGMSADHLISADVILADGSLQTWREFTKDELGKVKDEDGIWGEIIRAVLNVQSNHADSIKQNFPKTWRNSAGYRLNYLLPFSASKPSRWEGDYPNIHPFDVAQGKPSSFSLHPLLAGSEGTLAVIRRLKVNLVPKPKYTMLGVLSYEGVAEACDDVPRLLEMNPSAVELIPRLILEQARSIPAYARQMGWVIGNPAAVLAVEFSGDQLSALREAVLALRQHSPGGSLRSARNELLTIAESAEEQSRIWNIRKVGLGILDSRPQSARPIAFIEDCAIPVERLGEFVREIEKILSAHGTYGGIYAHASGGCLHIRPALDLQRGEGVRAMRSIVEQVFALTMSLGGAMSSEHGDGLARGEFIERTYGREVTEAMRSLKRAADPKNILNPKKLFDAPPMDTNLRYGETYQAKAWTSVLHFEHERGLAGAIEMCNGQGVCRKLALRGTEGTTGVMCPSFQATREEANSTRGRANLLRELVRTGMSLRGTALSNAKGSDEAISLLNGKLLRREERPPRSDMIESAFSALDLCLACKGCTSECPSGVDMPKLKYEFMNEYYKTHPRKMRDYLFGYFHVAAKLIQPFAPLANLFMKMNWSRRLIARMLGIAEERPFPVFGVGRQVNKERFALSGAERSRNAGSVIFLSDVFSHYIEPEVEDAAIRILNALGYEVKILPIIGAGASLLSKGFLDAARRHAENVLAEIQRLDAGAGLSVVGCEPPEVYCLKHEYKSLLPSRRAEIESITKQVWLVDEFVVRALERGSLLPHIRQQAVRLQRIIFHPHCHQRAEGLAEDGLPCGVSATVAMLKTFGFDVDVIEAGCCGMAGTFGYDAEHFELSMQVGELGVFREVRNAEGRGENVISSGAACRMQIEHGAGVKAVHPLLLVAGKL